MKNRPATVSDVAALARVSTATVSRALNPASAELVSIEARERVFAAAAELDYTANHAARSLKTRSTRTVAVLAPEFANDFFMELAEGVERELEISGYMLLVASSVNSQAEEAKRLALLSRRLVDGIIVIPAGPRGEHLQAISDRGTPVVLVDRLVEGAHLDAALSDNEAGAAELTRALLSDGFSRIAFVGGDVTISTARERLSGFARALAEAGLPADAGSTRLGGMGIEDGHRRMDEILRSDDPPQALFAVNLLVHLGMQRRLLEAGKDADGRPVSDRFVLASFDETPYSPFLPSCRYTASQDAAGLGAAAARLVLERIRARGHATGFAAAPGTAPAPAEARIVRLGTTLIRHPRG
ncbi:MAG TPA: LacI family transcriptional regulator [Treponema sp.]|nr:MAG: LacI family transcriptional regulator [Treponema sp. GWC1_61_84]HCM27588.1 LacI family transcriptional regulator [Treponema sp.]